MQARNIESVRMIQTSSAPGAVVNYTFTIEQGKVVKYQNGSEIVPWVKLTIPNCINSSSGIKVFDHSSGKIKLHQMLSSFDVVFQLNSGLNFYSLLNMVNPNESCQYKAERLSFEFRTYLDSNLTYPMDQKVSGLEPSLACNSPCGTCNVVEKSFCRSCIDQSMLLLRETGKCYSGISCPSGFFSPKSFEGNVQNECHQCGAGCSSCQEFTGLCSKCSDGNLLNVNNNKCIPRS